MRTRRIALAAILVVVIAGMAMATGEGEAASAGPVHLKGFFPGDRPEQWDEVMGEAYERLDAEGISVRVDANFVPWGDLDQKRQVILAAGEDYDMVFDAPWSTMEEMIDAGHYRDLEPLIEEYGPNIKSVRPDDMWEANRFNGVIYGIPLGAENVGGRGWVVRKDLREAYGMEPLGSFDDLVDFLYAVKENNPELIPVNTQRLGFFEDRMFAASRTQSMGPGHVLYLDLDANDGEIHNRFDEMDDFFWNLLLDIRQYYQDGIIDPDVMATQNGQDEFVAGRTAAVVVNGFGVKSDWPEKVTAIHPEAELEYVTFMDPDFRRPISFRQFNFITIPIYSEREEEVMRFLDWANIKENYDLLTYGIEGEHWRPVGDDRFEQIGGGYRWFPYVWIWNPTHHRLNSNLPENVVWWKHWDADASNYRRSVDTGLVYDDDTYEDEQSQVEALEAQLFEPLQHGVVPVEEFWTDYRERCYDYIKTIQRNMQQQLDAHMAANQ